MSLRLHRELGDGAVVLDGPWPEAGRAAADHLVVAPSGVWVIVSKQMDGLIEYRDVGGAAGGDGRLLVGGHDRTSMADAIDDHVLPVADLVGDPAVPVHPAIVFVEGHWGGPTRLLTKRPFRLQGVWILWPAALIAKIEEPGPLDPETVSGVGQALERALPPR